MQHDVNDPKTILERYSAAVASNDIEALLALYAPEARVFDMTMPWQHLNLDGWREKTSDWFHHMRGLEAAANASEVEMHTSDGMALMTMLMAYYDVNDKGEREGMTNRLTWVLVPAGDDWKILHEHTSAPLSQDEFEVVMEPYVTPPRHRGR